MEVIVITKVVAKPIATADSTLPVTPKKGQIPRKYLRTKLLTKAALKKSRINFIS